MTIQHELLSKIEDNQRIINSHRPFDPEFLKEVQDFYRVGIVYSSNALEGYTYTISETKILLEDGLTAGGKPMRDAYAVLGHARAYDYMFSLLKQSSISEEDILYMHRLIGDSLDNDAVAGAYRENRAFITGSSYPVSAPQKIEAEMSALVEQIAKNEDNLHPVELAAQLHKGMVFIHPFADGNGRVARLAMNTVLLQNSYMPVVIPPVLRHEYIESLERARSGDQDFVNFIARSEIETQKEFIRLLAIEEPQKKPHARCKM